MSLLFVFSNQVYEVYTEALLPLEVSYKSDSASSQQKVHLTVEDAFLWQWGAQAPKVMILTSRDYSVHQQGIAEWPCLPCPLPPQPEGTVQGTYTAVNLPSDPEISCLCSLCNAWMLVSSFFFFLSFYQRSLLCPIQSPSYNAQHKRVLSRQCEGLLSSGTLGVFCTGP